MKRIIFCAALGLILSATSNTGFAAVSEGSKCKKANIVTKNGSESFICLKSGKSLLLIPKFKKCADVISAGRSPIIKEDDPLLYLANAGLDRDKDGTACDI